MDLGQARDSVYLRTGYDSTDGLLTPERVNELLRAALQFIASEHDWDWLQTTETLSTVSGTNYVTPLAGSSTGVTWIRTLWLTGPSNSNMVQIPWEEFRLRPETSTGQPYVYAERIGRLYLWPVPDAVYTLTHQFTRGETTLQSDTDSPLLLPQFHDAWVEKAVAYACRRVGEPAAAQAAEGEYNAWRGVMMDNRRRSSGPRRVAVRPGSLL